MVLPAAVVFLSRQVFLPGGYPGPDSPRVAAGLMALPARTWGSAVVAQGPRRLSAAEVVPGEVEALELAEVQPMATDQAAVAVVVAMGPLVPAQMVVLAAPVRRAF